MKRLVILAAVVLCSIPTLAGEYLINEEVAYGLRVTFSEPVTITRFGDVLMQISPDGEATEFLFFGGELPAWAGHWMAWSPVSARIVMYEWVSDANATASTTTSQIEPRFVSAIHVKRDGSDGVGAACTTQSGQLLVAGHVRPNDGEFSEILLASIDDSGAVSYFRTLEGVADVENAVHAYSVATSITACSEGGCIVAADLHRHFVNPNRNEYYLWLGRGAEDGDLAWQSTYRDFHESKAIEPTAEGGYLIGATVYSAERDADCAVLKLDAMGEAEWARAYGGRQTDKLMDLAAAENGNYLLAGTSLSDGWIAQVDPQGDIVWEAVWGGPADDAFYDVEATLDGGCVVVGETCGHSTLADGWVLKLDESGAREWEIRVGGSRDDAIQVIIQLPDGGYLAAGGTWSFGVEQVSPWLIRFDSDGAILWQRVLSLLRYSVMESLILLNDETVLAVTDAANSATEDRDLWLLMIEESSAETTPCEAIGAITPNARVFPMESVPRETSATRETLDVETLQASGDWVDWAVEVFDACLGQE